LNEGCNNLVQILRTDARGFLALWFGEPFDLYLKLPRLLVEADIAFVGVIAAFAVIETVARSALLVLWFELKARGRRLFHKQARRDGLQRIVHRLSDASTEASGSAIRFVNRARVLPGASRVARHSC
jgi:hypothetical protein